MKDIPKIAFERSPLAAFAEKLGQMGYGSEWAATSGLTKQGQVRSADAKKREMHNDVFKQISLALGHGFAEAQVIIDLNEVGVEYCSDISEVSDTDDSDSDISDADLEIPTEHYVLSPSFWLQDWQSRIIEWQTSTLLIDLESVRISKSSPFSATQIRAQSLFKERPELKPHKKKSLAGQIFIKRSEIALGYVSGIISPFPGIAKDRYKGLDNRFLDELVAVVWRQLAIELIKSQRKKVKPQKMIDIINQYADPFKQNADLNMVGESTIAAVCTKLYKQFKNEEKTTQPFINSTPDRTRYFKRFVKTK